MNLFKTYLKSYDLLKIIFILVPLYTFMSYSLDYDLGYMFIATFIGLSIPMLVSVNERGMMPNPNHPILQLLPESFETKKKVWFFSYFCSLIFILTPLAISLNLLFTFTKHDSLPLVVNLLIPSMGISLALIFTLLAPPQLTEDMKDKLAYFIKGIALFFAIVIFPLLHQVIYITNSIIGVLILMTINALLLIILLYGILKSD